MIDIPNLPASAALFLDFDGTLVPLADRPQDVCVPDWVVPTLQLLMQRLDGALAIVSGRSIIQIDEFLRPLVIAVSGAHGAEHRSASGHTCICRKKPPSTVVDCAQALAQRYSGLIYESKSGGFSLHFRARPELENCCWDSLTAALASYAEISGEASKWELRRGHCVFELRQYDVSKGTALQSFLGEPIFSGRVPVFVGDDATDEDGIAVAQACGGFGVRVGSGVTQARYRLCDIDAVAVWLKNAVHAY